METKEKAKPVSIGQELVSSDPRGMMALALEHNADPEVLKKLMDLQERWDAMSARKAYVKAMAEFKRECPAVLVKDATVDFTSQKGRTSYNHATLGGIVKSITSMLSNHGLHASWETKQEPNVVQVTCHITHEEGHRESTSLAGPPDDSGNKNRIQMIGSSVTYLQRYTLLAALGLATADQDDADTRKAPAMPKAKEEKGPVAETPKEPQASTDPMTVRGEVESAGIKTGERNGKPWHKLGVKVGGEWYSTFDTKIEPPAKGDSIEITYKPDGQFKTLISWCYVSDAAPAEREPGAEG